MVVENRPGAGGALGARVVATHRLMATRCWPATPARLRQFRPCLESAGYDPVKDFAPIIRINEGYQILVVHPDSEWKTLKDFVAYAKANPGKINYGHTGPAGCRIWPARFSSCAAAPS